MFLTVFMSTSSLGSGSPDWEAPYHVAATSESGIGGGKVQFGLEG